MGPESPKNADRNVQGEDCSPASSVDQDSADCQSEHCAESERYLIDSKCKAKFMGWRGISD